MELNVKKERKKATEKAMRTTARSQEKRQQRSLTKVAKVTFHASRAAAYA